MLPKSPSDVAQAFEQWERAGGTHASVVTMRVGLGGAAAHVDYLGRVGDTLSLGATTLSSRTR